MDSSRHQPGCKALLKATLCTLALLATPAYAQDPQAPAATSSSAGDGEIIITARKRNESILQVPVIATAITQKEITAFAIDDIEAIADHVAGLQLGNGVGQNGTQISLRGVGAGVVNPAIEQSISLNIDGVQMTTGNAYKVGMFDLAQVEVLKGPQSLFFGKNSPGGVVSLRTADPGNEVELIGRVSYEFEANEKRVELIASGPVTDTLGLRLAGYYVDADGYFRNEAIAIPGLGGLPPKHKRFGGSEYAVRGTALWRPDERFTARLKLNYNHSRAQGEAQQFISCPDGTVSPVGIPFLLGEDCEADRIVRSVDLDPVAFPLINNGGVPVRKFDQTFGSLEMNYEVSAGLTVTSLSGFYVLKQDAVYSLFTSGAASPLAVNDTLKRRDISQEVRLTSDFTGPLDFMIGGFFHDGSVDYAFELPGNTAFGFLPPNLGAAAHEVDIRAVSLFGQILWKVVPEVEVAAGARWTHEKRSHRAFDTITGVPVEVPLATPEISSSNVSPEVSITYTPTQDLTLFISYKTGFKSGSFNVTGTPPANSETSFNDEKVKGFEGGVKARLLDRHLDVGLAGYYYKYSDLQVGATLNDPTQGFGVRTLNAASAKVYGIDFDLRYRIPSVENLSLNTAISWNHARYKKFDNAQCWGGQMISEGCNLLFNPSTQLFNAQDLSGRELLRAPEWTATASFDYEFPVSSGIKVALGGGGRYSSSYFTNFLLRDDMVQDSYVKLNARVAIGAEDDRWELALIGNNLTDKKTCGNSSNSNLQNGLIFGGVITGGTTRGAAGVDELLCALELGREVQLRLSVRL